MYNNLWATSTKGSLRHAVVRMGMGMKMEIYGDGDDDVEGEGYKAAGVGSPSLGYFNLPPARQVACPPSQVGDSRACL